MKNIITTCVTFCMVLLVLNFLHAEPYRGPRYQSKSGLGYTAGCVPASAMTDLDYNNVRATILNGGDMWWDLSNAQYEVPKGSGKTALFAGAIWVGGVDVNGQLRVCAQMHRNDGNDFWPGPLIATGSGIASVSPEVCTRYDKHYKIHKTDVQKFRSWFNSSAEERNRDYPNYSIPEVIMNWPAHGPTDASPDYDYFLAPFVDANSDNFYNYLDGDYPNYPLDGIPDCNTRPERLAVNLNNATNYLRGDQTLWWVYNDKGNIHTQTTGAASIGMEFRSQAFSFSTNDELNNMTFYNYEIINRSTYTLTETYFGVWTDADLGDAFDDFVGCDVQKGLGYLYNGDADDGDGNGRTYGSQPPAVGIDFFEGPYQDANNLDDLSNYDAKNNLNCEMGYRYDIEGNLLYTGPGDIFNGNINGLNFGDNIKDNERWGMRRYLYFNNGGGQTGDPHTAIEYYNYLRGIWKDGKNLQYGGTGHNQGNAPRADFMFPDNTDKCGWGTAGIPQSAWSEYTVGNTPDDRRFVQSAGPFTLEPGAVNYITLGAVWARAITGGPWASVQEVRKADDKAQKLFEACFQLIDGPDAPEITVVEMDNKFIIQIWNRPSSNNYLESYKEKDPFIPEDVPDKDRFFAFQGYQVFQLKNKNVTVNDIHNPDLAKLVFQCDIKDKVTKITNYKWNDEIGANEPILEVDGKNQGITHTFVVTDDLFAREARQLVNYREYYYVALAYAHNDYKHYDQSASGSLGCQTAPYKAGRKSADGPIRVITAIPHPNDQLNNGTLVNAQYGDTPEITQIEGHGNGMNYLDLSPETISNIMAKTSKPFKADEVKYARGCAPVSVKVIDPLNVPTGDFLLKLSPDSIHKVANYWNPSANANYVPSTGMIYDSKWKLYRLENGVKTDSVSSDAWIRINDEKLIAKWGISLTFAQVDYPDIKYGKFDELVPVNGGVLTSQYAYQNPSPAWLGFIPDDEGLSPFNWIRSGNTSDKDNASVNDWPGRDPDQNFEKILGGTWAPYFLTSPAKYGPANDKAGLASQEFSKYRLASVDVVFTHDRSLWTRCPVIEMCENDAGTNTNTLSEGMALRFDIRRAPSIDKDGNYAAAGAEDDTVNVNAPNYIGATGMSWFPGYAIDVETGERLNIMFGEDSWLIGDNGRDMKFNPTSNIADNLYWATGGAAGTIIMGGKHFIYIVGHHVNANKVLMPAYDEGRTLYQGLKYGTAAVKKEIWRTPIWVSIPYAPLQQYEFTNYADMPRNPLTIKLRVANPYLVSIVDLAVQNPQNNNFPLYSFNLDDLATVKNSAGNLKNAIDKINVVPNPYYGYSTYERSQLENIVKITNLPQKCTISIFNVNGTLVRRFEKDNDLSSVDWDLKNTYGISIASGVYIIHVKAPGYGEKILKWFGALRPIDLNAF